MAMLKMKFKRPVRPWQLVLISKGFEGSASEISYIRYTKGEFIN